MKKLLTLFTASIIVLTLVACSDTSSSNGSSGADLEEIYQKAIDRQSEIESMSSDTVLNQMMSFEESGELFEFETKTDLKADFTLDPFTSHMEGIVSTTDPATGDSIGLEIEMYMSQDGLYMYETTSERWFELPADGMNDILGQASNQMDAAEQLKQLELLISEFKIEETNDEYILTLEAAGDKFTEYIIEQKGLFSSVGITEAEEDIMEAIKYDEVSYIININKETFDMTAMDMTIKMSIEEDDEKIDVETESKITFSDFNSIEEIKAPQEVIDKAEKVY